MEKFILIVFAFAMAQAHAVEPSSYASLKPFATFAEGTGEGVAYRYWSRTKEQFVSLLRDEAFAKKEMRVGCSVLVSQMVEARPGLPFEGCEGAAAAIENNEDYAVADCRDEMFTEANWLTVTNKEGSAFGIWHRTCLKGEQVLMYKNQPLISLNCLNVVIPVRQQSACYITPFDYRKTDDVVWNDKHNAHVSAHFNASEAELETIYNDPCFGVNDANGFRKPFHRCETCETGAYPPKALAIAVGIMEEEPKGVLSFDLQDGVGEFSLPISWAERWMLFCVDVGPYSVSVSGYERWHAVSLFDVVTRDEIKSTLSAGRLPRTLVGSEHY